MRGANSFTVIDVNAARLSRLQKRVHGYNQALNEGMVTKTLFQSINRNKRKTDPSTYMATLTYRPGETWEPGDIKRVTQWLKRKFGTWLLSYAWVLELQAREAPHYHLYATFAKGSMPYLDRPQGERGYIPWTKGTTKVEKARSIFYLSKYIGKEYQKDYHKFPKGVRSFGIWVSALYSWETRNGVRKTVLPAWVRECITEAQMKAGKLSITPSRGGGWNIYGTLVSSDYEYMFTEEREIDSKRLLEVWEYQTRGQESPRVGISVAEYKKMHTF
jgi:hypothetical protein